MSAKNIFVRLVAGAALTLPAFSQGETPVYKNEASVQALGSFVKNTTDNGIEQKATHSGGVLANYRYFFNEHHGVEFNYGYTLNTQSYGLGGAPVGVKTYSHEVSADYVLRFPQKHWTPFALAGVGGLIFDPKDFVGASVQTRPAFVYGGGADFNVTKRVFIRAEYRGFVYKSPTYDLTGLDGVDRITHRAEPSVGFGFKF
jgi:opacity protein-like surface antigen